MATLSDRIAQHRPCRKCAWSEGAWGSDAEDHPTPGRRCSCRRGYLLAIGDAARARRDFSVPLPGPISQQEERSNPIGE